MQRSTVGRLAARVAALLLACGLISCGGGDSFETREKPQSIDGANLAQWSSLITAPMVPVAPALFSTTKDCLSFSPSLGATARDLVGGAASGEGHDQGDGPVGPGLGRCRKGSERGQGQRHGTKNVIHLVS